MVVSSGKVVHRSAFEEHYPRTPHRRLLGRGAFGSVFAVTSKTDPDSQYVAKEIQVSSLSQKKQREALAEVELLKALSHPHVVELVDTLLLNGVLYMVMEYATGGDLAQQIRAQRESGGRFPEKAVMKTFAQVASAVDFVHGQKILHRDIKPANIFVFGSQELALCSVKLGDFGLGKMFESTTFEALSVVGSPSYFSPEVCNGRPYGRKTDVWSLGALLYEMACLEVPFLAKTILAVALLICKSEAKALPGEYSMDLHRLVGRMLEKDPAARPNMKAVLQEPIVQEFLPALPASLDGRLGASQTLNETLETTATTTAESRQSDSAAPPPAACNQNRVLAEIIESSFSEHDLGGKRGEVPPEVLAQLLQLVVPGLSGEAVSQVLASAGCRQGSEAIEISAFLEWLCQ